MIVYAESSAVLSWLLGEPGQERTRKILAGAERVVTSSLTGVECARALGRARGQGRLTPTHELAALRLLDVALGAWDVHDLSDRILARARAGFPADPVRTLDALHLATALTFREAVGPLNVLSLDERVRANAAALGLGLLP
ncbi:MAG: type II toxin-antitoxin system VapC family toxin [Gemmatimonadales bacterium]